MTITLTDIIALSAAIISALSLVYSILLNLKQGKYIKHQDELNKLLLEKEKSEIEKESFADVSAKVVKLGQSKYYIRVYNQGKAKANNLDFEMIDSKWMIMNHVFPLEYLDPGSSVDMNLALFLGCELKGKCKIKWHDKSGKQEREVILVV